MTPLSKAQRLVLIARTREALHLDAPDWQAWEREMREDVEQDAIRYWEGE